MIGMVPRVSRGVVASLLVPLPRQIHRAAAKDLDQWDSQRQELWLRKTALEMSLDHGGPVEVAE